MGGVVGGTESFPLPSLELRYIRCTDYSLLHADRILLSANMLPDESNNPIVFEFVACLIVGIVIITNYTSKLDLNTLTMSSVL